jgi:hypothetical protein
MRDEEVRKWMREADPTTKRKVESGTSNRANGERNNQPAGDRQDD